MILIRALYWFLPSLLCVALYWHGLKAWFQMDDFAWLTLHTRVQDFPSLLTTLFQPMAQGTVRPLSERLFFLSFWHLFGMEALPYRSVVFATQFANLVLICLIVRRLSSSAVAGFAAPLLWLASPVLYLPMVWTSAYNQILCSFFLLSAFWFLLRYVDNGRKRNYAVMWAAFILGFGALELNVVFPAIALLYVLFFARNHVRAVAPLFVVSIAFAIWHRSAGQGLTNPVYSMQLHPRTVLQVLGKYTWMSVSGAPAARFVEVQGIIPDACSAAVLAVLVTFGTAMVWRRNWLAVFFLGWFGIALAPYLPLANHISDYYLTVPTIGLAMLGGWGIGMAACAGPSKRIIAAVAVLLFVIPCGWQAWKLSQWYAAKSWRLRSVMRGVASAHSRHPGRWIVLHGVDDDLFWYGLYDRPEAPLGWRSLYLTADTQGAISAVRDEDISDRFLPQSVTLEAIRHEQALVYDVSGGRLRNITRPYLQLRSQSDEGQLAPRFINAANPLFASYLKEGWQSTVGAYRWTSQRASLLLAAPPASGFGIRLRGRVTEAHTASQPISLAISIDGMQLGTQTIRQGAVDFDLVFPVGNEWVGRKALLVTVETNRTISDFGVALGTASLVPVRASELLP